MFVSCKLIFNRALVLSLLGLAYPHSAHAEGEADENSSASPELTEVDTVPGVRTVALGSVFQPAERSAPAKTLSLNHSRIAAEINARIVKLDVEVGDSVSAGQVLVSMDCSDYERASAEARARLDVNNSRLKLAEQQLERTRRLVQSKSMSDNALDRDQAEYDSATAEITAQRAMLARAENQASRCIIRAPYNAVVSNRIGQIGEFTAPGMILLEIVDVNNVELSVQIPDAEADGLLNISESSFVYAGEQYPMILRTILPIVDEITRSREARFRFVSQAAMVGSIGRLRWTASETALPAQYISQRDGKSGVIIADGEVARFIPIPDAQEGRPAIVALDPVTRLITDGRHGLQDGDAIAIQE